MLGAPGRKKFRRLRRLQKVVYIGPKANTSSLEEEEDCTATLLNVAVRNAFQNALVSGDESIAQWV